MHARNSAVFVVKMVNNPVIVTILANFLFKAIIVDLVHPISLENAASKAAWFGAKSSSRTNAQLVAPWMGPGRVFPFHGERAAIADVVLQRDDDFSC